MYSKSVLAMAALLSATIWIGCDDEQKSDHPNCGQGVSLVQIVAEDTIVFLPADSASTPVTVIVSGPDGSAIPGVQVDFSLANPALGGLEFLNLVLRDTTDQRGRIQAVYRCFARSGDQLLTAEADGVFANLVIYQRETDGGFYPMTLIITPRAFVADSNETVETHVEITITDESNRGIPNVLILSAVTGGALSALPPTDSTGRTQGTWSFLNEFGGFAMTVSAAGLWATDTVHVALREVPN